MIHIVLLHGENGNHVAAAEAALQAGGHGWIRVKPRVWLVGSDLDASAWRDILAGEGVDVVVAELSGSWASRGMNQVGNWLQGARRAF